MKIVHYPHPALRCQAKPISSIDKKIKLQIGEMFDLMYEAKGLGLAATQVALPFQLLVMNVSGDPEKKNMNLFTSTPPWLSVRAPWMVKKVALAFLVCSKSSQG